MRPQALKTYHFANHDDLSGTINALRVAAERFDEDAKMTGDAYGANNPVPEQFRRQAAQARRIADAMKEMAY